MPTSKKIPRKNKNPKYVKRFMGGELHWTVEFETNPFDSFGTDDHYIVKMRISGQPPDTAIALAETRASTYQDCLNKFAQSLDMLMAGAWRIKES